MEEEQVDIVGSERSQSLVNLFDHLARLVGMILGGQEDLLADLGLGGEPGLEAVLGMVARGGVVIADPAQERVAQQAVK